jgi:peptide-methionine (R)-S-oxide reductase
MKKYSKKLNNRRKFLELISFSYLSVLLLPFNLLHATTKKIINQNLTAEQKKIMLDESTERPFSSPLNYEKRKGFFHCANCGAKLFSSTAKFDSGTGWPSFKESLPGAFKTKIDYSFGMKRVEYHCAKCGVHHGHVFDDGSTTTQKRFCSNGLCLIFKPAS